MKIKYFLLLSILFITLFAFSEEKIFIPEYEFKKFNLIDSKTNRSKAFWIIAENTFEDFNIDKFYFPKDKLNENSAVGLIRYKFSNVSEAEKSVLFWDIFSNASLFPVLQGTVSRKNIGYKNYVQGTGIIAFDELKISDLDYYLNYEYKTGDRLYHLGLFVIMEDGWTFEVYQTLDKYQPWMGRLDPEMLEYLAEKGVEVYYAKKCDVKIEPHKWNLNWSEDNADPEGLINVWIGNIEEGISVEDIDLSTVVMNGKVPVFKNIGFENNENFQGKVLHLQFKKKESFETIFFPQKGDLREICIEGKLKTGEDFIGRTTVEIIGKE